VKIPSFILACAIGILVAQSAFCAERSAPRPLPDPEVQTGITRTVEAIVDAGRSGSEEEALQQIDRLEKTTAGDREALLLQLLLYLAEAKGTEQAMGGALLMNHLEFSIEEKIGVALSYLEADDRALQKLLRELLSTVDRPDGGEPDFRAYETVLHRDKNDPPLALIRYMFSVSPEEASRSLNRVTPDGGLCDAIERDTPDLRCQR